MLSGTAEYALRAVVHLARLPAGETMRADELAAAVDVPRNYLSKVLHELVRAGVLRSTRGKNGGFQLALDPADLSLARVVGRFDRIQDGSRRCLMGRPECNDRSPCPVHTRWKSTADQIARFFRDTKVADVLG